MTRPPLTAITLLSALLGTMVACERSEGKTSSAARAPTTGATSGAMSSATTSAPSVQTVAHHYEIDGMHCEGCVAAIESKVKALPGVSLCTVDLETRRALVQSASADDDAAIRAAVERLGYKIKPVP